MNKTSILAVIKDSTTNYYLKNLGQETASKKVGWRDEVAQSRRFEALYRLLPKSKSFSLNDIGCGRADFLDFINLNKSQCTLYHGYDILDEMILEARSLHAAEEANIKVNIHKINELSEIKHADYSIASGIFNLRGNISNEMWAKYIYDTINLMNSKSKQGFGFNCLSSYSDREHQRQDLYYTNPTVIFNYIAQNISQNISLLHDYHEHDFTILVLKHK